VPLLYALSTWTRGLWFATSSACNSPPPRWIVNGHRTTVTPRTQDCVKAVAVLTVAGDRGMPASMMRVLESFGYIDLCSRRKDAQSASNPGGPLAIVELDGGTSASVLSRIAANGNRLQRRTNKFSSSCCSSAVRGTITRRTGLGASGPANVMRDAVGLVKSNGPQRAGKRMQQPIATRLSNVGRDPPGRRNGADALPERFCGTSTKPSVGSC